ncbi:uncharacterized protein LOC111097902 isoform X1 [Canis lupus familiaris]|uniref:uncharacterized protein LOC111097902 isoform X1 n=1 Tax=Canis lupus familiaris TaxID=9615 RepID=UPI000BA9FECD|nr:uncharacterized protein LOC111097902 isoform X1 [Canis lupus familiaris]|eukprot:XP_022280717.1 uncharacterized protein LOC111097902 isoform X1 [Canis lupus familiaris]
MPGPDPWAQAPPTPGPPLLLSFLFSPLMAGAPNCRVLAYAIVSWPPALTPDPPRLGSGLTHVQQTPPTAILRAGAASCGADASGPSVTRTHRLLWLAPQLSLLSLFLVWINDAFTWFKIPRQQGCTQKSPCAPPSSHQDSPRGDPGGTPDPYVRSRSVRYKGKQTHVSVLSPPRYSSYTRGFPHMFIGAVFFSRRDRATAWGGFPVNAHYVTYVKKPRWMGVELPSSSVLLRAALPSKPVPVLGSSRLALSPAMKRLRFLQGAPRVFLGILWAACKLGGTERPSGSPGAGCWVPGTVGEGASLRGPRRLREGGAGTEAGARRAGGKACVALSSWHFTPKRCSGTPEGALCSVSPESGDRRAMRGSGPRGRVLRRSRVAVTLAARRGPGTSSRQRLPVTRVGEAR